MLVLVSWESIVYADNYTLVCVCLLYTEAAFSQSACLLARVECVNIFTVNVGCDWLRLSLSLYYVTAWV